MSNSIELLREEVVKLCNPTDLFSKIPLDELKHYEELLDNNHLKRLFDDKELINTVEVFFRNNLNISATSKDAFMHRNTLIYRIEKIKKDTGLNIKKFEDARILYNLMTIQNIIKKNS
jgi:carbohydrate diacid regulator